MNAYDILAIRGVTRLCHFTKLQSFIHIISSVDGILSSNSIRQDTKNVTDKARYDGELNHVCCSVEYPNSWFLNRARERYIDNVFNEWIVLYINLSILNHRSAKFCPCNASKLSGKYIDDNMNNIESIFADTVPTFSRSRSSKMLSCCPTDGQAEILVRDNIPPEYIGGIAVGNKDIASRVYAMFITLNIQPIPIYIAPDVLTPKWNDIIRNGQRPDEEECVWQKEE